MMQKTALMVLVISALLLIFLILIATAHGHSFYSNACCAETHCHPVPCAQVKPAGDGWEWQGEQFQHHMLRISPDGLCHVCVAAAPVCIYLPGQS